MKSMKVPDTEANPEPERTQNRNILILRAVEQLSGPGIFLTGSLNHVHY